MDPGHFEPNAKLKAMDRDGVFAEVIFPEVAGAKLINPHLMGDDWQEDFVGYNNAMADFAAVDPVRLMTADQLPLYDIESALKVCERRLRAAQGPRVQRRPVQP